nr:phosphoribosylamine--glycine ligase [Ktedonobacterales bacterium]
PFSGFLYAGMMLTPDGPRVVEFNARFGDPEAQVVLPLLADDFLALCHAAATGRLHELPPPALRAEAACGVVLAAATYPTSGSKGAPITGLATVDADVLIFQAGTQMHDGQFVTNGGRILTVVGLGNDRAAARDQAYANIERISFAGARYRTDIGAK